MKKLLSQPRALFGGTALVSLGLVGAGVLLAQWMNLAACPLCILQRMLYLLLAAVALLGVLASRPAQQRLAALTMSAVAATGAFVAGYQVWIQNFARETDCSANAPWWEELVYWASEKAPLLFGVSGLCSEPGWKFLGLSIAAWSMLAFAALFVVAVFAVRAQLVGSRRENS